MTKPSTSAGSAVPFFDAYLMVDWSAESRPKTGRDSIWIAGLERDDSTCQPIGPVNPPTRAAAGDWLTARLSDLVGRNRRTLVGFDFAFGYPAGFAAHLNPVDPSWRGVWAALHDRIQDGDDNTNNRLHVAAEINGSVSGHAFPFWGCPSAQTNPHLGPTRPDGYADTAHPDTTGRSLAERRHCDRRAARAQPVWKLAYPGSVGGQTLLGIARLWALRNDPRLRDVTRIWPFETGLAALTRERMNGCRIVLAEAWPSMLSVSAKADEVKDEAQVRTLAHYLADRDSAGTLAGSFAGPADLSLDARRAAEREEGWILAIEDETAPRATSRYDYVRDPAAIYERSFTIIRQETDLSVLPYDLAGLAVRLIHACGQIDIIGDLTWSAGAGAAGHAALAAGAPILVDTKMVAAGIIRASLPAGNAVICTLDDDATSPLSATLRTTRSAAAVDLWGDRLGGAIVVIGNAPTALFRVLERIDAGAPKPAVVLGFPVGFVGAAESKDALIAHGSGIPHIALRGRRGGSALAAAAVNALAVDDGAGS